MATIRNALLYAKNNREATDEKLTDYLERYPGVTRVLHSERSKSLIFIDYKSDIVSLTEVTRELGRNGLNVSIVDM